MADRFVSSPTTVIVAGNRVVVPLKFQTVYGDPLTSQDPSRLDRVVFKRDDGRGGQYEHVIRGPYEVSTLSYRPAWTAEVDISRLDGGGWATFAIRVGDEIEVEAENNPGIDADLETKDVQKYTVTGVNQDRISFSGWSLNADSYPAVVSIRRKRHPLSPHVPGVLLYENVQVIAEVPGNRKIVRTDEGVLDVYWQTDERTPSGRYSAVGYWVDSEQNERTTRQVEFTIVLPPTPSGSQAGPVTSNWEDVYMRWLPSLYDNIAQDEKVKGMIRVIGKVTNAMNSAIQSFVDAADPLRAGPRELAHMANNLGWKLLGNNPESWRRQLFNAVEINGLKGTKESIERSLSFIDATVVGWSSYWQVLPKYTWTDYSVITDSDAQGRPVMRLSHRPVSQVAYGREGDLDVINETLAGMQLPAPGMDFPSVINDFWKIERRRPAPAVFRLATGVSVSSLRWDDTNDLVYANPSSNVVVYRQRQVPAEDDGSVYGELRTVSGWWWVDRYYVRIIDGDHAGYYPIANIDGRKLGNDDYILVNDVPDALKGRLLRAEIVVRTRFVSDGNRLTGKFVTLSNSRSDEAIFGDADDDTYAARPYMFLPPPWQVVFDGIEDSETKDIDSVVIVKGNELVWIGEEPTFEDVEDKEDAYLTSIGDQLLSGDWRAIVMAAGFEARPKDTGAIMGDELKVTYLRKKMPLVYYAKKEGELVSTTSDDENGFGLIRKNEYEAEFILSSLPLADKRDPASRELYFAKSKPPVDFNTRLLEDGSESLPLICATLNPAAEPVVFGHVRTDARWSTKIYNEETYDGSMKPSNNPCDIEPDFREECDCAWSSFFSVQVEVGMLSDEKTRLCQEVIDRFSPVQAILHELSVIGRVDDSTMIQHDRPVIDVDIDFEDVVFDSPVYFDRSGLHGRRRGDLVEEVTVVTGSGVAVNKVWDIFDTTVPDMRGGYSGTKVRFINGITADLSGAERWSFEFSNEDLDDSHFGEVSYELYRDKKMGSCTVTVQSRYYVKPNGHATVMGYAGSERVYSRLSGPGADLSGLPLNLGSDGSYRLRVIENGIALDTYNILGYDYNGIEVDRALPSRSVVFQLIYRDANGHDVVLSDGRGDVSASFVGSLSGEIEGLVNFTPETRDEAGRSIMALFIETNSIRIGNDWHRIISVMPDRILIEWKAESGYNGPFYLSELIHSSVEGVLSWRSNTIELDFDVEAQALASISANDPGLPPASVERDLQEFLIVYDGRYYAISGRPASGLTTIIGWVESPNATASLVHLLPKDGQRFNMGGKKVRWTSADVDMNSGEWAGARRIWPTEAGQISESIQITVEDDGQQRRTFVLE